MLRTNLHTNLCFFWICIFLLLQTSLSANNYKFKTLSVNAGLAHTDVKSLAQDSTGLLWVGTSAGIQSYDGYSFTTYDYYKHDQPIYSSHNRVCSISCSKKLLWVGSESGLTCIDLDKHHYIPYTIEGGNIKEIRNEAIRQVNVDAGGEILWIFTAQNCFAAKVDEKNYSLSLLSWKNPEDMYRASDRYSLEEGIVWGLEKEYIKRLSIENGVVTTRRFHYKDKINDGDEAAYQLQVASGHLYLRTLYGCYRIQLAPDQLPNFTQMVYQPFHSTNTSIPLKTSGHFTVDEKTGDLWCSYWAGLFHISQPFTHSATIKNYFHNTENIRLSKLKITSLFLDRYDKLWVGMDSRGLHFKPLNPLPFHQIPKEKFLEKGYFRNEVIAVAKQEPNILWMIIENSSLFSYNEDTEELSLLSLGNNKDVPATLQSIYLSRDQKHLYIGADNGLSRYEINTGNLSQVIGGSSSPIPWEESITQMAEDQWGRLWVGTWRSGVYGFDVSGKEPVRIQQFSTDTHPAQTSNQVTDVRIGNQFLLVATVNGLNKIIMNHQGEIKNIIHCQIDSQNANSMSSNYLAAIDIENDSTYWVGTIGGGLNRIMLHSDTHNDYTASVYTKQSGMSGNDTESVRHDKDGYIWVGGTGISRLDPRTGKITVYNANDGLQASSFKMGVRDQGSDGTIYMGGPEGLNYFQPKEFNHTPEHMDLIVNNLHINHQLVMPDKEYEGEIILKKHSIKRVR